MAFLYFAICSWRRGYGTDTLTRKIQNINDAIVFNDIASKYYNEDIKYTFNIYGYDSVESTLRASHSNQIAISRNSTYAKIKGIVRDSLSDNFIEGITITIEEQRAESNAKGYFEIVIPIEKQRKIYDATLTKGNKEISASKIYPTENNETKINTLYF